MGDPQEDLLTVWEMSILPDSVTELLKFCQGMGKLRAYSKIPTNVTIDIGKAKDNRCQVVTFPVYNKKMPRLFISINCDTATKASLLAVRDQIKAQSVKGNFSRPENLHLTLVFLGETPEDQMRAISSAITAATQDTTAFTLNFTRTGCFRHSNKELWWVGADDEASSPSASNEASNILTGIRHRLEEQLSANSITFDTRPFHPHITLGREIKHTSSIVLPKIDITLPATRISLMKSERINGTLTYTEVFGKDLIIID
jgi:2'-5' RNA ligase